MWRGTKGTVYDVSAQYLASAGIEISPEVLKYAVRTATGGVGAFVDSTVSAAMLKTQGAELDTREIPFVRKFYGEATIQDATIAAIPCYVPCGLELNKIYNESNLDTMKRMPDNFVDLTVTSPPYDNLRDDKDYYNKNYTDLTQQSYGEYSYITENVS